jgi:hypothetical protein
LARGEAERLRVRVTALLAHPALGVLSLFDGTLHFTRLSRWTGSTAGPKQAL